jgi:apolipoprotein N-acyltransferase
MDLDYTSKINQAGRKGVDILLVPGMEGNPEQSPWHVRFAPFRAVENGFTVVRLAVGGVSITSDPYGQLLVYMDYFKTNDRVMVVQVPTYGVFTLYSVTGDLFGWLTVAGSVVIAGWAIYRGRKAGTQATALPEAETRSA